MIKKKNGIALPVVLFVLVGLLLSSVILIRSAEFSNTISGDLGFKNQTSNMNEWVTSQAYNWLAANKTSLNNNNEQAGYFSSLPATLPDYTNENSWYGARDLGLDPLGNKASYIIRRMCQQSNLSYNGVSNGVANQCAVKQFSDSDSTSNSVGFNSFNFVGNPQVYFKIVVKTEGPRNTTSISETIVSLAQ